jgi:uncharacterized ion transporter superfamily protein YfcC
VFRSIPAGVAQASGLIFMILSIGGMFGVLRATGALDKGIERLLAATRGNVYLLAPLLMLAISAGSTFLGLISEYLMIIPLALALAGRLRLDALFATALVAIPAKIGYLASVTNPLPLAIAQPLVGVPVFSGAGLRLAIYVLYLALGILYLLRYVRRSGFAAPPIEPDSAPLPARHFAVLASLGMAVGVVVAGARSWGWGNGELAAFYLALSCLVALLGGVPARHAAESFLEGMKGMVLAALLVGLAGAVEIVLKDGQVLDTIINGLAAMAQGKPPVVVAQSLVVIEMILDVLIPSTSGKAAISMPVLGPIAQLSGVSGQTTVLAYLFGNGITNMITPTSGMLLAYLATGRVGYGEWLRFILPLVALLTALSLAAAAFAVVIGY